MKSTNNHSLFSTEPYYNIDHTEKFSPLPFQQVAQEKAQTETKWKEEKKRRIKTEKRLRLAEDSLKRLDRALRDSGVNIDIQIETDVKNLKGERLIN